MDDNTLNQFRRQLAQINGIKMNESTKPTRSQQKKLEDAAGEHRAKLIHAYMTARANDKNPRDLRGAHLRACEAAAAAHPTNHLGKPTFPSHVEHAVGIHMGNVSGTAPGEPYDGSGNQQPSPGPRRGNQQ